MAIKSSILQNKLTKLLHESLRVYLQASSFNLPVSQISVIDFVLEIKHKVDIESICRFVNDYRLPNNTEKNGLIEYVRLLEYTLKELNGDCFVMSEDEDKKELDEKVMIFMYLVVFGYLRANDSQASLRIFSVVIRFCLGRSVTKSIELIAGRIFEETCLPLSLRVMSGSHSFEYKNGVRYVSGEPIKSIETKISQQIKPQFLLHLRDEFKHRRYHFLKLITTTSLIHSYISQGLLPQASTFFSNAKINLNHIYLRQECSFVYIYAKLNAVLGEYKKGWSFISLALYFLPQNDLHKMSDKIIAKQNDKLEVYKGCPLELIAQIKKLRMVLILLLGLHDSKHAEKMIFEDNIVVGANDNLRMINSSFRSYYELTKAVRSGDSNKLKQILINDKKQFIDDDMYDIILRLENVTLKNSLYNIMLVYSKISLDKICNRLSGNKNDILSVMNTVIKERNVKGSISGDYFISQSNKDLDFNSPLSDIKRKEMLNLHNKINNTKTCCNQMESHYEYPNENKPIENRMINQIKIQKQLKSLRKEIYRDQ